MSYASFILPGSTKSPAHSVDAPAPVHSGSPTDPHPWILLVPSDVCNIPKFKRSSCRSLPGRCIILNYQHWYENAAD